MPRNASLLVVLAAVTLGALIGGCGTDGGDEDGVRSGGSSAWSVKSVDGPRTLEVGTGVGYCVGAPKPRMAAPEIEYLDDDVFVTLTIEEPPPRPTKANEVCAGVELFVGRKITLRRDLDEVRIYDGGVDPPLQRWPRQ